MYDDEVLAQIFAGYHGAYLPRERTKLFVRVVLTHIFALSMGALVPRREANKHVWEVLAQIN